MLGLGQDEPWHSKDWSLERAGETKAGNARGVILDQTKGEIAI